jgi:hypothetical protein
MSSAKMARQRGSAASAAAAKENGVKVEEGLSVFKSDKFDADGFVQARCSLNEKVLFFSLASFFFFSLWFLL